MRDKRPRVAIALFNSHLETSGNEYYCGSAQARSGRRSTAAFNDFVERMCWKKAQSSRESAQIVVTSSLRTGQFVCTWPKDKLMSNK